jgi:N-acetylmuramoyl-L-alanine amidase
MGADGKMEYEFNRRMVELIAADLQQNDRIRTVIVNREAKPITLSGRAAAARAAGADLLLSKPQRPSSTLSSAMFLLLFLLMACRRSALTPIYI